MTFGNSESFTYSCFQESKVPIGWSSDPPRDVSCLASTLPNEMVVRLDVVGCEAGVRLDMCQVSSRAAGKI